jgi:tetratricopeptide (TPR) repeat protein
VADIFISYTSSDRDWAFWIARELEALGHMPHVHEWELEGGDDIYAWMQRRHEAADHVLCVISDEYLKAPYSTLERNAALWQAAAKRPGFVLLVAVRPCKLPTLSDHIRRAELFGVPEDAARLRFREFMAKRGAPAAAAFPGKAFALSNIPIRVPTHFMGRDEPLAAIEAALARYEGRVAISALHGLRGVGKTTLAAAYAERHRGDYRATWWIRAQTESTLRADLVALGIRLGWIGADDKEEPAMAAVMERLRHEGEGVLLIFDNAIDAVALKPYLPRGGAARVLVTSNAHAWRGVAAPVEIRLWPREIGADYLIVRTGREAERAAAEALSQALGGLPLAHEQAAAYCERLDISLAEYRKRFEASPARLLDAARDAPSEYHDGLTVAKTFALAIEQATKLHPAAEPLIVHAALLAPEPIPLFLFSEAREKFGEPLASLLADEGLDEALAALRVFALIDRETIVDERDPSVATDAFRLHRLVREVAAARRDGETREPLRRVLIAALTAVYPDDGFDNPASWPRSAMLTPHLLASCEMGISDDAGNAQCAELLSRAGSYFHGHAAYSSARPLFERALAICEKALGPEHPDTAQSLNALALLLQVQGDFAAARPLHERALAIRENALGPEHRDTASTLNDLAILLEEQGDLAGARPLYERALSIYEKTVGPGHPWTAASLNNLAILLEEQGDLVGSRPLKERALAIREKVLGPEHPHTAQSLDNLAVLLKNQGDLARARPLYERALAIREKALGPEHPGTARSLGNLASLLRDTGRAREAEPLFRRAIAIDEKTVGFEHSNVATGYSNLACLLRDDGREAESEPLFLRAIAIGEKALGFEHPLTRRYQSHYARLLLNTNRPAEALALGEAALATHETASGPNHPWTKNSARVTADALEALGRAEQAAALRARHGLPGDSRSK